MLSKESAVVRYGGIKYDGKRTSVDFRNRGELIALRLFTTEIKPWMFDPVNGSMANQTTPNYLGSGNGTLTTTNNPLLTSYFSPSPSIYSNTTRIGNKKQSKNGGGTLTAGGFQDQNAIRRGFNGTETTNGGTGRNKEGRQRNNRKQISNGGGSGGVGVAAQNSDEGPEWSNDRDSANYAEPKYYLGKLIQGTYCSRVFSDCEKRACRMQSPNYPGVYPRNLTCFYAVRQVSSCEIISLITTMDIETGSLPISTTCHRESTR